MSELIVIKSPKLLHRIDTGIDTGFSSNGEEVVGVVDSGRTITKFGYDPNVFDYEDTISLAEGQPDRVIDAFEQTAASPPELKKYINCHMFAHYALGKARALERRDFYLANVLSIVQADSLNAGDPYSTVMPNGTINHSLIGIDDSSKSLSVLGEYGIFAIMDNENLKSFYKADRIVAIHLQNLDDDE